VAAYLALIVMVILLSSNVVAAMAYSHRVQGVADAAIVYGHDRSLLIGKPQITTLRSSVENFLQTAPSAKRLDLVVVNISVSGETSELELCAQLKYPLTLGTGVVCRKANARSFLLP
jgi:D-arabinose 5-phosphate isomerase GutQ